MGFIGSARKYQAASLAAIDVTLTDIEIGDVIIAAQGYFFNNGPVTPLMYTCSDDAGDDYDSPGGTWTAGPGFGQVVVFHTVAKVAGSIKITMTEDRARPDRYILVANIRNIGKFYQTALQAFPYTPATPGTWPVGNQTGFFNLADTCVVSLFYGQTGTPIIDGSGASAKANAPNPIGTPYSQPELYLFVEDFTGPGFAQTRIKTTSASGPSTHPLLSLVFHKPLADDENDNSAILPGCGEAHYNPAASGNSGPEDVPQTNRPLAIIMPRRPKIGNLVWGGISVATAGSGFGVVTPDPYGNVWTITDASPGFGNNTWVRLFHTVITHLPISGEAFQITLTANATISDVIYQVTSIGAKEKKIVGSPTNYSFYKWDHDIVSGPSITPITQQAIGVPENTYLVAFAAYGPVGTENSVVWSAEGTWNIIRKSEYVCEPFTITNDPRIMPCVLMDQVAVAGNYDARVEGTRNGGIAINENASIAMLAITLLPPGSLTALKIVVGGPASASDWTITADGASPQSGAGGFGPVEVDAGTYIFDEDAGAPGYSPGPWVFTGGTPAGANSRLIEDGDDVIATIINYFGGSPPVTQEEWFELYRVYTSMRAHARLPVRGGSTE